MSECFYVSILYDCSGQSYHDQFALDKSADLKPLVDEALEELKEGGYEGACFFKAELDKPMERILELDCSQAEDGYEFQGNYPILNSPKDFYWCRYCEFMYGISAETKKECLDCGNRLYDMSGEEISEEFNREDCDLNDDE